VTCRVPHGTDIGPLLFVSYIDDVLRIYHNCAVSDFQKCIDELNLDLQRVHEWAAANGLKPNPIKSPVIVISCCRVGKVINLGFVLNERLTATDHFKEGLLDVALFEAIFIASIV
jgi:hypothetical protein